MVLVESFSGIRGIYDKGLDAKVAAKYAYSYLSWLKNKHNNKIKNNNGKKLKIIIGTDTRQSKDILKNAVIEVLDCDIIDIGIASTPMTEFAVRHFKADGGIVITASHNEPYWNGFKFLDKDGAVLRPKDMETVIKTYKKTKKLDIKNIKEVIKKYNEINGAYSDFILHFLRNDEKNKIKGSKLKVIIDPNGGTGIIAKTIIEKLNIKVHGINMKHGIFNRQIEPTEDSLFYLSNDVREKNYDFAAGFDCDADRVEIITSKGFVSGNKLLALITDNILNRAKNKVVVVNDATSSVVKDIAKKHNAKYIETGVGEINVVDEIYRLKAPVGGEGSSSGIIIPPSKCRDGILTLIYLLKIIADKKRTLDELIETLPEYYNIKSKFNVNNKKYSNMKKKIIEFYSNKGHKAKDTQGGSLKIFLKDNSFVWFRTSKTEANILRVIADSKSREQTESIMQEAITLTKLQNIRR